jgi:hypothetical protein
MGGPEKHLHRAVQELLRRIDDRPQERLKIIQSYYAELVRAGDVETANLILTVKAIAMARDEQLSRGVPAWFTVAGFVAGAITLLFVMGLVLTSLAIKEVPQGSRFLVLIVVAVGMALSSSFLGGSAVASGKIPFFKDTPLVFSATGGIAVFVIVLLIGKYAWA